MLNKVSSDFHGSRKQKIACGKIEIHFREILVGMEIPLSGKEHMTPLS